MGLLDVLQNPTIEALLPALLGGVGRGLSSPRLAGTRGAVGQGILGAGEGLSTGIQTAQQQQRLNMEQQKAPLEMNELQAQTQALQTQNQQNQIILSNEKLRQQFGMSIKDPTDQARYFADPAAYFQRDMMMKAVPASLSALKATGLPQNALDEYAKIGASDPAMLHDIAQKAAEAHAAGKETDLQKLHDAYMKQPGMNDTGAWKQAAMDLKAAPQIAITEAKGAEARTTKETPGAAPATPAGGQATVNQKAMDTARKTYESNFGDLNKNWAKNEETIKLIDPDAKAPPTYDDWLKSDPGQESLKNAGYKALDETTSAPAAAPAKPAGKPAAASPGPSGSKGKSPPKEESTPHGLAKYDESKSKKAGKPIYVAPDGTMWG